MRNGPLPVPGRSPKSLALIVSFLFAIVPLTAHGQASIGIYSDLSRSSCSLSDAGGGLIYAYVIANTQSGLTGVRFAAPKPDCFNATWVSDEVPDAFFSIGDSQTDISIATGVCAPGATHVLTMAFQKVSPTAACCEFPLVAAHSESNVIYTNCTFAEIPMPAAQGFINADGSCPCTPPFDLPPSVPISPIPSDGMTNAPSYLSLIWQAHDPEGLPLKYDVYFGTTTNPPLVGNDLTVPEYPVGALAGDTFHYWKVVAIDVTNQTTAGPLWSFTTGSVGLPPPPPNNPGPANGSIDQLRRLALSWGTASGVGAILGYEVYLGTSVTPPKIGQTSAFSQFFDVDSLLLDTTYYWRVVSLGDGDQTTPGPTWSFHTVTTNPPPAAPATPIPAHEATTFAADVTLKWVGSDPEEQPLKYDVYFGTEADPPFLAQVTSPEKALGALTSEVDYYWRVVAIDPDGASTSGPVWRFRAIDAPSGTPVLVTPPDSSIVSRVGVQLKWLATAPGGGLLTYAVYFGAAADPPIYIANTPNSLVNLPTLLAEAKYYWRIVVREAGIVVANGPVWTFETLPITPPEAPSNPNPATGATNVERDPLLSWYSSDPDSPVLTYNVYFGETSPPPLVESGVDAMPYAPEGPLPLGALQRGTLHYWKIVARDSDGNTTSGPIWDFTTSNSNQPPSAPSGPFPAHDATSVPLTVALQWLPSTDPEGLGLRYDVYLGTNTNQLARVAYSITETTYGLSLLTNTDYYWRIVARDVDENEVAGPLWKFRTTTHTTNTVLLGLYSDELGTSCRLSDNGAGMRNVYVVLDGPTTYTGVRFAAPVPSCFDATWMYDTTPYVTFGDSREDVSVGFGFCLPPPVTVMTITYLSNGNSDGCCQFPLVAPQIIGRMLATDCSFAEITAQSHPSLGISSDNSCPPCGQSGFLRFAESADTCQIGPDHLITLNLEMSPTDSVSSGGLDVTFSPSLTFVSCERGGLTQDWTTFTSQVTGNVLTISGTANPGYDPMSAGVYARVTFETNCCEWTEPAELHLSDATGDFAELGLLNRILACRYGPDGDVNNDGVLTVADAQCALDVYLYAPYSIPGGCGGPEYMIRADVNCSGAPTPGDAYCIFRQWLDQSCTFCTGFGSAMDATGVSPPLTLRVVREGDEIVVVLRASGAGTMDALGFELEYPKGLELIRVEPPRRDAYAALQARTVTPGRLRIGAYADAGHAPSVNGDLIAVRFRANPALMHDTVKAVRFVDGLSGAPDLVASLDGSAVTPSATQVVLHQNSPNPFNPQTSIRFELPDAMHVRLRIFDVHGRFVKQLLDERRDAGASDVEWNGTDDRGATVATGVYFYVLDAGGKRYQHKMVLLK